MMEEEEYLGSEEQRQDPLEGFNLVLLDNDFASRSAIATRLSTRPPQTSTRTLSLSTRFQRG